MKDNILRLRKEGKSYREIKKELGCSFSTISYHCGKGQKEKSLKRQRKYKFTDKQNLQKKINRFNSRGFKNKSRDFQRERDEKGYWSGVGENLHNFTVEELLINLMENPICYLTGDVIDLSNTSSYSFDHIIPVSSGGSSDLSNLGLCTKEANMSKHKLSKEEFIILCKKVLINNGCEIIERKPVR